MVSGMYCQTLPHDETGAEKERASVEKRPGSSSRPAASAAARLASAAAASSASRMRCSTGLCSRPAMYSVSQVCRSRSSTSAPTTPYLITCARLAGTLGRPYPTLGRQKAACCDTELPRASADTWIPGQSGPLGTPLTSEKFSTPRVRRSQDSTSTPATP